MKIHDYGKMAVFLVLALLATVGLLAGRVSEANWLMVIMGELLYITGNGINAIKGVAASPILTAKRSVPALVTIPAEQSPVTVPAEITPPQAQPDQANEHPSLDAWRARAAGRLTDRDYASGTADALVDLYLAGGLTAVLDKYGATVAERVATVVASIGKPPPA